MSSPMWGCNLIDMAAKLIKGQIEKPNSIGSEYDTFRPMNIIRKEGLIGLAVLCMTIPSMLVAQATEKQTLVGVWEVKITAGGVQSPPLLSIAIFNGDGSFSTSGNTKFSLAPPNQGLADARGLGYGRWAQTSGKEFKLTFYSVLLKEGDVNGYLRVDSTMILSDSGDEFTARECQVDFLDTNWKMLDSDKDEVKGTRLETP